MHYNISCGFKRQIIPFTHINKNKRPPKSPNVVSEKSKRVFHVTFSANNCVMYCQTSTSPIVVVMLGYSLRFTSDVENMYFLRCKICLCSPHFKLSSML